MSRFAVRPFAILALFSLILGFVFPTFAQQNQPPDYVITVNEVGELTSDGRAIIVRFEVDNTGGDASETTFARLVDPRETVNINASIPVPALPSGISQQLSLSFPSDLFPPGSLQPLRIEITSGRVPIASREFNLQIPGGGVVTPATPQPDNGGTIIIPANEQLVEIGGYLLSYGDLFWIFRIVIGLVVGILVLIVYIILRLLFQRPPSFGSWQPPYANMPTMNPDTVSGRRQLWQQHAQNNGLPSQCSEGALQARKILLGMDGANLAGWRIIAMRMSQYDMYGRVARSQILASKGLVRKLDRVAHRSQNKDVEQITKRMRPIAKRLGSQFSKKVNKRSASLPLALDIRMQGRHGEVRIVFELHQCTGGQWHQIDGWEPEMTVISKAIHDSYTYTIYGQAGGETFKEYRQRIDNDITRVLTQLAAPRPSKINTPDTMQSVQRVESAQ